MSRLQREANTIAAMIRLYCRDLHNPGGRTCRACQELLAYTELRIHKCPHEDRKPSCAKCQIHCFRADFRQQMKVVMRHAGPRMLWRHPWLSVLHYLDSLRSGVLEKRSRARILRQAALPQSEIRPDGARPTASR